ncbi:3-dehydroquinate synthase [Aeribacillus alveayuensis]|uniref:3-dehydroquinate synthase n=1 Tax=Aeribacillus alveayuensis TaxID=279215 RepID=A0ABT9VL86_9BACI|nr:3-dehydroquinate synthase [Bacillus alveayuensis]
MKEIKVQTTSRTYPVIIGKNLISHLSNILSNIELAPTKMMVITDETVSTLFRDRFERELKTIGIDYFFHVVPSGEKSKSFETYYECMTAALTNHLDRRSLMIAFGGGVIGDLTGFIAATYMRGIPFLQIPTTLLAHDSAVGGKVAINHPLGKNMIGAFYQPHAVIYDIQFLETLPIDEIRSGFAEVVKHGLIKDPLFVDWLVQHVHHLQQLKEEQLLTFIEKGITIKAEIVSEDEKELGTRAFLNFGHTLGHALEAALGYGRISHGDAVAIGMLFALYVSNQTFGIDLGYERMKEWFQKIGFPTSVHSSISSEQLCERMKNDKKSVNNEIRMVLLENIGTPKLVNFDEKTIYSLLQQWRGGAI